ncbi:unnamed protein product, partial [Ixodes persulcatus]
SPFVGSPGTRKLSRVADREELQLPRLPTSDKALACRTFLSVQNESPGGVLIREKHHKRPYSVTNYTYYKHYNESNMSGIPSWLNPLQHLVFQKKNKHEFLFLSVPTKSSPFYSFFTKSGRTKYKMFCE